jgi:ubiquinone/menaquinone biosynthesis C-methylase UbiE
VKGTVRQEEGRTSIVRTPVDGVLGEMGYDLTAEVREILELSDLSHGRPVLELATGTGRTIAVLTRLGYRVLTGDLTLGELATAKARVGASYLQSVRFLRLMIEHLPFGDRSVPSLVSFTTIHELERPIPCVEEMVRVLEPGGVLVIADFNEAGFVALQHVHRKLNRRDHPRGFLPMADVKAILRRRSLLVRDLRTPLLTGCIATRTPAVSS